MKTRNREKIKKLSFIITSSLILSILFVSLFNFGAFQSHDLDKKIDKSMESNKDIKLELISKGKFRCCLEKPCSYCLFKKGSCDCLDDVVTGKHPCGECIGEILEGHGNPYLAEYFAKSIAEKVGEEHIDTLRKIIEEKYNLSVENQL